MRVSPPATVIVASGFLPGHLPAGCDLGDMTVKFRRIFGRIGAQYCFFGRWDRDLDRRSEPSVKQFRCWFSVVSSICEERINRTADVILG
jgi:hypothetical protein